MLKLYFKIALRNLLKYRTQNIISVVGLAVGIFCFSICFYVTRFAGNMDGFYDHSDRIAVLHLYSMQEGVREDFVPGELDYGTAPVKLGWDVAGKELSSVEAVTSVINSGDKYKYEVSGRLYRLQHLEVDSLYARVFTPEIVCGSWEVAAAHENSLIMSRTTAQRLFGGAEEAIGRTVTARNSINGRAGLIYTVRAVMEDMPLNNRWNAMCHIDMLMLNAINGFLADGINTDFINQNFVLLKEDASIEDLNEELVRTFPVYVPDSRKVWEHFPEAKLYTDTENPYMLAGWIVGAVGILILLICFINMFHFMVGSFFNRSKEFSIMKLLGSNRRRLFLLLAIECSVIIGCASFLLLWLIEILGDRLGFDFETYDMMMRFDVGLMYIYALQYIGVTVFISLVIAYLTAVYISRISVSTGVYGAGRRAGRPVWRNISIGFQFFISWIFITMTVAICLQSRKVMHSSYNTLSVREKQDILYVPLNESLAGVQERLVTVDRLRQIPGVMDVMLKPYHVPDFLTGEDGVQHAIPIFAVPENFFDFMNISVESGYLLEKESDMVIERRLCADSGNGDENMQGKHFSADGMSYTVSGICEKFYMDNMYDVGNVFVPWKGKGTVYGCYVKCYPGMADEVREKVVAVYKDYLPQGEDSDVQTLMEVIKYQNPMEFMLLRITLLFSVFCIVITMLGVYSSITLDTERRQKEVAIRKVCGAGKPQILMLFSRLYIILLTVTILIALPIMHIIITYIKEQSQVFFSYGALFWLAIFLAVALLTFVTIIFRILRISRQNPAEVIKNE